MPSNALYDLVATYGPLAGEDGPIRFVREILGVEPDPWQEEVLRAYGRGERRIAVKSAHGVGKTFVAAVISVYALVCRFPQKTVATAPAVAQLHGALLPEVKKWISRLNPRLQELFDVRSESVFLLANPNESRFEARTSRAENPEALQGIHCDPGYVTIIGDESSGIPQQVFESAIGSMSGSNATTLLIGNPVRTSGFFYECFHRAKGIWHTITVAHGDSPRVTKDFAMQVARTYGKESNAYRVRCLGEFPLSDDDTVIPFSFVDSARGRDIVEAPNAAEVWGVDVARYGKDKSALVKRTNRRVVAIDVWGEADVMETTGRVKAAWDDALTKPRIIIVDEIGLGAGVLDRLRELKLSPTRIRGVNVAEAPTVQNDCHRVRDELWFKAREWFEGLDVALPPYDRNADADEDPFEMLVQELLTPSFKYRSNGKKLVESKDEMRRRGFASPNVADAFCLTFAESAAAMMGGSNQWLEGEPIRRNLALV